MLKVSIIIPTYNRAHIISEAIDSIQKQTYPHWELLVVDDCSTDNTLDIVQRYAKADSRIRVFHLENNSGRPAVPRNYGLRHAAGKYITFLDSDDIWLPEKLQEQVNCMEANKEIYLLYTKCYLQKYGEIIGILPKEKDIKTGRIFEPLFLSFNFIFCLTVMLRNEKKDYEYFFDEDPRLQASEDFDLWLRIAKNEHIGFLDKPLAIYRIHKRNLSGGVILSFKRNLYLINKWKGSIRKTLLFKKYPRLLIFTLYLVFTKFFFSRPARIRLKLKLDS